MTCTGLLGGTFDPPHRGHVLLAETAKRHFEIDPCACSCPRTRRTSRSSTPRTPPRPRRGSRSRTTTVVRDEHPYSIDTVSGYGDDAIFLVGADQFANFLTWRAPEEILEHVRLGVATRPGYRRDELERRPRAARAARAGGVLRSGARADLVERDSRAAPRGRAHRGPRAGGRRREIDRLGLYRGRLGVS